MHFLNNLQTNVQIQLAIIFELYQVVSKLRPAGRVPLS
jgi:hypothetical protein